MFNTNFSNKIQLKIKNNFFYFTRSDGFNIFLTLRRIRSGQHVSNPGMLYYLVISLHVRSNKIQLLIKHNLNKW